MMNISRKLAREFVYVRIDFYILKSELKFDEMTFTPGGGIYRYNAGWTLEIDKKLGDMIDIRNLDAL